MDLIWLVLFGPAGGGCFAHHKPLLVYFLYYFWLWLCIMYYTYYICIFYNTVFCIMLPWGQDTLTSSRAVQGLFMPSLIRKKIRTPPRRRRLIHARHDHPGSSRVRLEATAAVLTGAASICTIERLLLMWLASPIARPPDPIAMRCANSMKRQRPVR